MTQVAELISSVLTVDDGLRKIASLEKKPRDLDKNAEKSEQEGGSLLLDEFKQAFYNMPIVNLTMAVNPTRSFLTGVQGWFSENLGKKAVLRLDVDPEIIGGVKVVCNDHYLDLSVAAALDDIFGNQVNVEAGTSARASTLI